MEILIYIAVLSVIFASVYGFLTWAVQSNIKTKAIREVADNARRAMEIMTYEIREAKSVYTPTFSADQLSLETTHNLPSGESSTFVDFFLCGESDALCLKRESQNPVAVTSDTVRVSSLEFLQISTTTPSVRIKLKINYKTNSGRQEYQASIHSTSTVSLRNY